MLHYNYIDLMNSSVYSVKLWENRVVKSVLFVMFVSHFLYLLAALQPVTNHSRLKASNELRAFCTSSTTGLNIRALCGSSSFLEMMFLNATNACSLMLAD